MEIKRIRTKFKQFDDLGNLICYNCKKYKPIDNYDFNSKRWFRNNLDYRCKSCKKQQYLKRKTSNRGKKDLNRILLERWHGCKLRSKTELNFDWQYLKKLWTVQNGKCAISNIDMTFIMNSGRIPTNVSIDRINSNLGYSKDNIQLVCMAVNQMKNDLTIEQLLDFCTSIIKNAKKWAKK